MRPVQFVLSGLSTEQDDTVRRVFNDEMTWHDHHSSATQGTLTRIGAVLEWWRECLNEESPDRTTRSALEILEPLVVTRLGR